jgi:putative oxidoreductase
VDGLIGWNRGKSLQLRLEKWEPYTRSVLRIIVGFLLTLHGCRKLFDVLVSVAGRRNAPPLAIDALPSFTGYVDLVAGVLLMLGLFVRQTAAVVATEALLAYALFAQPRTLWPVRNGGNEALLYAVLGVLFAVAGARAWSLDAWRLDKSASAIDLHHSSERRRLRA